MNGETYYHGEFFRITVVKRLYGIYGILKSKKKAGGMYHRDIRS